jgi:NAD+ synthase
MIPVSLDVLRLDCEKETQRIVQSLKEVVLGRFRRNGGVVALSGGVDSSLTAALCVRALGRERVFGLLMPDRDSSPETWRLSRQVADDLGIDSELVDITAILQAEGCYRYRDEAVGRVVPGFDPKSRIKIVLSGEIGTPYRLFHLVIRSQEGKETRVRLPASEYRSVVASMNFKQRTRKMLEYFNADRLHYAVIGTSNRLEVDQGFFVKLGDGAGDFKPIAHLLKSQVYQMAEYLGVPEEIRQRPPTPDTYSLSQTHEEFYFPAPYQVMDLCLWAKGRGITPEEVAPVVGKDPLFVERVYRDVDAKRRVADYLGAAPVCLPDAQANVP